jgi:NAD(P)H-hydrate epimerase
MMRRAGAALARETASAARAAGLGGCGVAVFCGAGNNGGDGFHAAACLAADGFRPVVFFAGDAGKMSPETAACHARAERKGIEVVPVRAEEAFAGPLLPVAVDALLGTGAGGNLRGAVRRCAEFLAETAGLRRATVAADVPTGYDAEAGTVAPDGLFVRTDVTVAMGWPKAGMETAAGRDVCGSIRVADIGFPEACRGAAEEGAAEVEAITEAEARAVGGRRAAESHKGDYGRVFLFAGSAAYPGAGVLAAEAALRSGAGIVQVHTAEPERAAALAARVPAAVVNAAEPGARTDAVLVGPGLEADAARAAFAAVEAMGRPCALVLDAGALGNVEAERIARLAASGWRVVLTPHGGELARLAGGVAADRAATAREVARRTGAVVVAKGNRTLVVAPDGRMAVNLTGNAGMACGGSGDVLAGYLAGLLARCGGAAAEAFAVARAAVWRHGAAGDVAAFRFGQEAMQAGDLPAFLAGW